MIDWTPEFLTTVATRWIAAQSGAEIALELGNGLTRNAIITKMHHIGLTRTVCADAPAAASALAAAVKKAKTYQSAAAKAGAPLKQAPAPRQSAPRLVASASRPHRFDNLGEVLLADLPEPQPCGLPVRTMPTCLWSMDIGCPDPTDIQFCGQPATHSAHRMVRRPVYCAEHGLRSIGLGTTSERNAHKRIPVHA